MPFGTTNNVAELEAIKQCLLRLQAIKVARAGTLIETTFATVLSSDSQWAIRVITGEYKANVHLERIAHIQSLIEKLAPIKLSWVKGHAGASWNEAVDKMANLATYKEGSHPVVTNYSRADFIKHAEELITNYERIRAEQ